MIAMQTEQLGTGHAVMMAKEYINDNDTIVVLCGDTPLVKRRNIKEIIRLPYRTWISCNSSYN